MDTHDFSPAKEFGDVLPVLMGRVYIDDLEEIKDKIIDALTDATVHDYLLVSGSPIVVALGVEVWLRKFFNEAQFLYWHAGLQEYIVYTATEEGVILP